ncbi:hypothetical protein M2322_003529 [Rhodoblastus acidophilus]|uniref:hypothetical protein n=1 Tax=Rhodoblastus acidophilus TaxID=1074 RepID=UPI00222570B8|nr:hypothetical protein [Rhodoblastus acidophilus]MCW2317964.1 hypothetical protein [Rhodoblastus acidophilus]
MQILDIVTVVANPLRWESRTRLAKAAITAWLKEPNVRITLVESAYGGRPHELADFARERGLNYVPVRNYTLCWNKESLMNIGLHRAPDDAKYFATLDADVTWRKPGWAGEIIEALQIFPVIQPWSTAYDLGPNDEHIQTHTSFARLFHEGKPVVSKAAKFWKFNGGPYEYAHPGFAWAWTRDILDRIGGLFELGGMGSADHHMALGMVGAVDKSVPGGAHPNYLAALKAWEGRALTHINQKIGFIHQTIEHMFHGSKAARNYVGRWDMFVGHGFDPYHDLKRNTHGVLEFSGNKPELERQWHNYLSDRREDANFI